MWRAAGQQGGELHQKLQKAKRLLKQSKAKDGYKILGVARTIKKAYRKAAVNEAYEVLSKRGQLQSSRGPR